MQQNCRLIDPTWLDRRKIRLLHQISNMGYMRAELNWAFVRPGGRQILSPAEFAPVQAALKAYAAAREAKGHGQGNN